MGNTKSKYGDGDTTHLALGGVDGIQRLVEAFYEEMDSLPEARRIRELHPPDLTVSIDKLARFLSGWTGGPKRFNEKYGRISVPMFHRHLPVGEEGRDSWLLCMARALDRQAYPDELKQYMLEALFVPAERVRVVAEQHRAGPADESAGSSAKPRGSQ